MPQEQHHRGQHPKDARLFCAKWTPVLRKAVADLSLLLTREYAESAALRLVGDHYQLDARQRRAVLGASCGDATLQRRRAHEIGTDDLAGQVLRIDGYNLLIAAESALSHGILLRGRDGCIRDLASVHGSYRRVEETIPAIEALGGLLEKLSVLQAIWCFDAPVSNSGRLKAFIEEIVSTRNWPWRVELHPNPDKALAACTEIVVTSDGWILDRAQRWANVAAAFVQSLETPTAIVDLNSEGL